MRSVLSITWLNMRLLAADRSAFFWLLGMPVAFTFVFGIAFSGGGGGDVDPDEIRYALTVADLDPGPLSDELLERIEETDEIDLLMLEGPDAGEEARRLVDEGERSSALVIPPDFSARLASGERVALLFHRNPDRTNPQATRRTLDRIVARLNVEALAAEGATEAYSLLWGDPTPGTVRRLSVGVEQFVRESWETPPLTVSVERLGRSEPSDVPAMGFQHSSPAIALMYVLLNGLMFSIMLVEERRFRTLNRLFTAPVRRASVITANFLWRFVVAMFQASVLVVIGALVFGVDWGGSPGGLVAVFAAFGAAVSGLSVLLGSVARTTRQAQSAALVLALSMSALGGLWWPLEITPRAYQIAGHVVPTGWAMDAMHALVSRGHGLPEVLPEVWTLLAFAAAFSVAATLAFRSE
ncbi:MAG: ABC transporter permease subunit [Candidatus Eisenbacteria bacterium]|nr:ABC transporter permease subunit [Candidatus Eisenbacteria bacterium]